MSNQENQQNTLANPEQIAGLNHAAQLAVRHAEQDERHGAREAYLPIDKNRLGEAVYVKTGPGYTAVSHSEGEKLGDIERADTSYAFLDPNEPSYDPVYEGSGKFKTSDNTETGSQTLTSEAAERLTEKVAKGANLYPSTNLDTKNGERQVISPKEHLDKLFMTKREGYGQWSAASKKSELADDTYDEVLAKEGAEGERAAFTKVSNALAHERNIKRLQDK